MEYHFTGTGDSLDVTFIADGIIDGSGKAIPYSAIKSIKVKRRGNKAVLVIMVEENDTKVEYCYSVAPKDEESLKKAVADIEAYYIKKRKGKHLLNWKIIGVTAAIFLLVCGGGLGWYANNSRELATAKKQSIVKLLRRKKAAQITNLELSLKKQKPRKEQIQSIIVQNTPYTLQTSMQIRLYGQQRMNLLRKLKRECYMLEKREQRK